VRTPVTMPGTRVTVWPLSGETRVVPWMSWIRVVPGSVGSGVGVGSGVPPPGVCPAASTGVGAPEVRSAALSSVSAREAPRATEAVLLAPATGPLPSRTTAVP
jgi:hypothetical protein